MDIFFKFCFNLHNVRVNYINTLNFLARISNKHEILSLYQSDQNHISHLLSFTDMSWHGISE